MIQMEHIRKTYGSHKSNAHPVLRDISLTLPDTGFVCILGPSGCGKTTLMNVIGGLDSFDGGTITIGGATVQKYGTKAMEIERNQSFGYIFQNYYLLPDRSVTYNVFLGLHSLPLSRTEKLQRVKAALQAVEMEGFARKKVSDLSGGQQQRVAIARTIARKPRIIFADEPTGNLDSTNTNNVCRLLRRLSASCLVVMVTHEERIACTYAERIISLREGEICSDTQNQPKETNSLPFAFEKETDAKPCQSKSSRFGLRTMLDEAIQLIGGRGRQTSLLRICLFFLTMVMVIAIGDFQTLRNINKEEFITTDSHILDVEIRRGAVNTFSINEAYDEYVQYLNSSGLDITYLPLVPNIAVYSYDYFRQISALTDRLSNVSYVPLEKLPSQALLYGRMPKSPDEVIADRWVLDKFLEKNGVLQAVIEELPHFLGTSISFGQKNIKLKIVGICNSGEPSIYMDPFALISIGAAGNEVMGLSQLKQLFPGEYDTLTLSDDEIFLVEENGGARKRGSFYRTNGLLSYAVADNLDIKGIYPQFIINESQRGALLSSMLRSTRHFLIYTSEREAVKKLLSGELPDTLDGVIQVIVTDNYGDSMEEYQSAAAIRVNARTIVTATILLISAVMLLLLLRTRVDGRMDMLSVYRLLGIPNHKTLAIFAMESLFVSLTSALPAAILTWAVIKALTVMPSISFEMVLPFQTALLSYGAALLFQEAAFLLPALRKLRLPPAQLAAKFDF